MSASWPTSLSRFGDCRILTCGGATGDHLNPKESKTNWEIELVPGAMLLIMACLKVVMEDVLALRVRRGLAEYLLERAVCAASVAAVTHASPAATTELLSDIEKVKVRAGIALGKQSKATIREIQQGLVQRGYKQLAKK